ncbi:MAG TPA: ATP-grasp domain-containing protein [Fimbriimonadaceae bacterium]|nr:ATP-grasp domain-containing protein [Fimbriimonadaceae bacterium]
MRVLILAQSNWQGPARAPKYFKLAGCEVATLCKKGDIAGLSKYLDRRYYADTTSEAAVMTALDHALHDWRPDFILPGTDRMRTALANYLRINERAPEPVDSQILNAVRNSLYDLSKESLVLGKIDLLDELSRWGIAVAPQRELFTLGDADQFVQEHGYPVVIKPDIGFAGTGIRFCENEDELLEALQGILLPQKKGRVAIQKYLGDKSANFHFAAKNGKVLATNAYFRLRTHPAKTGPTTVAQVIRGTEMRAAAEAVCELVGYNGLGSVQFMVDDETGANPKVIEMNSRVSPFLHIGRLTGTDLIEALVHAHRGERVAIHPPKDGLTIALFPQEAIRDRNSEFLDGLVDRPDDDPDLLASYQAGIDHKWATVRT